MERLVIAKSVGDYILTCQQPGRDPLATSDEQLDESIRTGVRHYGSDPSALFVALCNQIWILQQRKPGSSQMTTLKRYAEVFRDLFFKGYRFNWELS